MPYFGNVPALTWVLIPGDRMTPPPGGIPAVAVHQEPAGARGLLSPLSLCATSSRDRMLLLAAALGGQAHGAPASPSDTALVPATCATSPVKGWQPRALPSLGALSDATPTSSPLPDVAPGESDTPGYCLSGQHRGSSWS